MLRVQGPGVFLGPEVWNLCLKANYSKHTVTKQNHCEEMILRYSHSTVHIAVVCYGTFPTFVEMHSDSETSCSGCNRSVCFVDEMTAFSSELVTLVCSVCGPRPKGIARIEKTKKNLSLSDDFI